jgi:hypothetical protein
MPTGNSARATSGTQGFPGKMPAMRWLALVVLVACGDNNLLQPDAAVPDATPPMPDAAACGSGESLCGTACLDTTNDELNCGGCDEACNGGEVCNGTCACPTDFIPAMVTPSGFDQFQDAQLFTIGIAPTFGVGGINPLLFGFDPVNTAVDTDFDLSTIAVPAVPFVGVGVGFDIGSMNLDATYLATAGTLRFTSICATEIRGTLTNATFRGLNGGLGGGIPEIDPDGCEVTVSSIEFHVSTAACE